MRIVTNLGWAVDFKLIMYADNIFSMAFYMFALAIWFY